MNQTINRILALGCAAAAVLVMTGCSSSKNGTADDGWQDPFFQSKESATASKSLARRQYAIASVQDGMLFPIHFDGAELNGLGQAKIDLMLEGRPAKSPLKVYLNQPADDATNNGRIAAVTRALHAAGLTDGDFTVAVGPNPGTLMPAEAGIRALQATDTNPQAASGGAPIATGNGGGESSSASAK